MFKLPADTDLEYSDHMDPAAVVPVFDQTRMVTGEYLPTDISDAMRPNDAACTKRPNRRKARGIRRYGVTDAFDASGGFSLEQTNSSRAFLKQKWIKRWRTVRIILMAMH